MSRTLWITTTAVFIALLIVAQALGAVFGQLVVGSLVNLILIITVSTGGLPSGLVVALMSPVFAKLIGIGPFWTIIPFVMAGNAALVLVWRCAGALRFTHVFFVRVITLILAAASKFLVLYLGVVKITVPFLLNLPEQQAALISGMFSFPQLLTASIGGALAVAILPLMEKVVRNIRRSES